MQRVCLNQYTRNTLMTTLAETIRTASLKHTHTLYNTLKGIPREDTSCSENVKISETAVWSFYQYLWNKGTFSASHLGPSGCSHIVSLFTDEKQKKLDSWHVARFCNSCQLCSWCHQPDHNSSSWSRFATFKHRFSAHKVLKQQKNGCVIFISFQ